MRLVVASNISRVKRKSIAGQAVLVLLGLLLMFVVSFLAVDVPAGTGHNLLNAGRHSIVTVIEKLPPLWQDKINHMAPTLLQETKPIRHVLYVPQVPTAVFLGYVLGPQAAAMSIGSFLLLGLIGPSVGINPLAGGGGFDYYSQPGFGYLLGMIACAYVVGLITEERRSSISQVLALVAGVVTVHLIGLAYMVSSCLMFSLMEGVKNGPLWLPWVFEEARNLTWFQIAYDSIFGFVLIGIGFPFRYLVNMLTAPDLALKSRSDKIVQQHMEELLN